MNKKYFFGLIIIILSQSTASAQQWIDKKYTYDSVLNIQYGTAKNFMGNLDTLRLNLYLPKCDDINHISKRPLMMVIHGGAFLAGNYNDQSIQDICKQFAKRGYVTASIGYRLGFISDDNLWQCNFPNYSCVFAADSSEWARAYFRAVQDAKGALRYLVNRNTQYRIDVNNIFVTGESAGALTALGVTFLDTAIEKPTHADSLNSVASPHSGTRNCTYNAGKTFSGNSILRPNLGSIDGNIEPSTIKYTIKGVGNMYGAMLGNYLKIQKVGKSKPVIYSFHQPCDMIVPIDSGYVNWGLSWCFTNGYNCYPMANNKVQLYGSRAISQWNTTNNYGYIIKNEFTSVNFPYNFLFGPGSCADQVNNPCHAYDNKKKRLDTMASFFAKYITTSPICDSANVSSYHQFAFENLKVYPNPSSGKVTIEGVFLEDEILTYQLTTITGKVIEKKLLKANNNKLILNFEHLKGFYILNIRNNKFEQNFKLNFQ